MDLDALDPRFFSTTEIPLSTGQYLLDHSAHLLRYRCDKIRVVEAAGNRWGILERSVGEPSTPNHHHLMWIRVRVQRAPKPMPEVLPPPEPLLPVLSPPPADPFTKVYLTEMALRMICPSSPGNLDEDWVLDVRPH